MSKWPAIEKIIGWNPHKPGPVNGLTVAEHIKLGKELLGPHYEELKHVWHRPPFLPEVMRQIIEHKEPR